MAENDKAAEKAAQAKDAALQGALTQIERQFGKGTVMRMGDEGAQVGSTPSRRGRSRSTSPSASAACPAGASSRSSARSRRARRP